MDKLSANTVYPLYPSSSPPASPPRSERLHDSLRPHICLRPPERIVLKVGHGSIMIHQILNLIGLIWTLPG